jgi:hypothetical protein
MAGRDTQAMPLGIAPCMVAGWLLLSAALGWAQQVHALVAHPSTQSRASDARASCATAACASSSPLQRCDPMDLTPRFAARAGPCPRVHSRHRLPRCRPPCPPVTTLRSRHRQPLQVRGTQRDRRPRRAKWTENRTPNCRPCFPRRHHNRRSCSGVAARSVPTGAVTLRWRPN